MNLFKYILHRADNPTKEEIERDKKMLEKYAKRKKTKKTNKTTKL